MTHPPRNQSSMVAAVQREASSSISRRSDHWRSPLRPLAPLDMPGLIVNLKPFASHPTCFGWTPIPPGNTVGLSTGDMVALGPRCHARAGSRTTHACAERFSSDKLSARETNPMRQRLLSGSAKAVPATRRPRVGRAASLGGSGGGPEGAAPGHQLRVSRSSLTRESTPNNRARGPSSTKRVRSTMPIITQILSVGFLNSSWTD